MNDKINRYESIVEQLNNEWMCDPPKIAYKFKWLDSLRNKTWLNAELNEKTIFLCDDKCQMAQLTLHASRRDGRNGRSVKRQRTDIFTHIRMRQAHVCLVKLNLYFV